MFTDRSKYRKEGRGGGGEGEGRGRGAIVRFLPFILFIVDYNTVYSSKRKVLQLTVTSLKCETQT